MSRQPVLSAILLPVALFIITGSMQAQRLGAPRFRPGDGQERAARVLDNVNRLNASLSAIRRVFVDTETGTAEWLELEPSVVARRDLSPTPQGAATRFIARYGMQIFGAPLPPADLQLVKTSTDGKLTHLRYAQRFKGWRVEGGELIVHVAEVNGRYAVQSLNGRIYPGIDAPAGPVLGFDAARTAATAAGGNTAANTTQDVDPIVVPDAAGFRLAYVVMVSDPKNGLVRRYVDAVSGIAFAETPGAIYEAVPASAFRAAKRVGPSSPSAPLGAMGYVSTFGTDALGANRTFNVWQASASLYQMASNGWPGITQVEIRNFLGGNMRLDDCGTNYAYASTSSIASGWPTTTNGKEEVSGVANMGASFQYLNSTFGRKGIYDDPTLHNARACVHAVYADTLGNLYFNAAFYPGNYSWVFVGAQPGSWNAASAAQDVVTHEVWHGVSTDEANFAWASEPGAINEGLSDFYAARHTGNTCLGYAALGFCLRNINSSPNLADLQSSCANDDWPDGEPHCLSVAYSSGLWATASKFATFGAPTDWAVYNGLRYYMTSSTTFILGRESVVRAAKDRLHNNQTNVNIIWDMEDAFYTRGIGFAPVLVNGASSGPCNTWVPDITGSGTRSFTLWFAAGAGFFNDGSVDHQFYSVNLGTFTDATLPTFASSQVGGHQINDGHDHSFMFRFTDVSPAVGFLDYWAPYTQQCGVQPVVAQQPDTAVATPDEGTPRTFAVRQAIPSSSGLISARVAAPVTGNDGAPAPRAGLADQIRAFGISALEIDVPTERAGQRLEITVFDLQGRRVRAITEDNVPAGRRSVVWDRLTTDGAPAPAGVYTVIVRYGSSVQRTRFIIPRTD